MRALWAYDPKMQLSKCSSKKTRQRELLVNIEQKVTAVDIQNGRI